MKMKELLLNKIRALYDIESIIIDSLPDVITVVEDRKLRKGLEDHLKESKDQSKRLEDAFKLLGEKPAKLEAEAIRGLVKDTRWVIENVEEGNPRDLNLTAALSYIEHYEMAGYMAAVMWAEKLGEDDVADLLNMSLAEEEAADGKLNDLAVTIAEKIE